MRGLGGMFELERKNDMGCSGVDMERLHGTFEL